MTTSNAYGQGNYAPVNGLQMYYEVHGSGEPLVMLHGAFMPIEAWGRLLPALAQTRQVIAIEQQAHGRTADIDRPLSYEQMADDTAALLRHIGLAQADVCGYSMGASIALQVAMRHPQLVRKLVFVSSAFASAGYLPGVLDLIQMITPELFAGSPWHDTYLRVAPNPDGFPALVAKIKQLDGASQDWSREAIRAFPAPTLAIFGDSDGYRLEHVTELFHLRGGGVFGDLHGLPPARLAVLPGTTHLGLLERCDWLVPMLAEFLDAPMPDAG
jgi:pimeloyl-ACP methyl ester carboxylesterase